MIIYSHLLFVIKPLIIVKWTHFCILCRISCVSLWTESVVPGYEGIVQPSGFLVPGKTKGRLQLYNMNAAIPAETEINIASGDAS